MEISAEKKVYLLLPQMVGGGAERVASLLLNEFYKNGIQVKMLLTSSDSAHVQRGMLDENIEIIAFGDLIKKGKASVGKRIKHAYSAVSCNLFEKMGKCVPASLAHTSFLDTYGEQVNLLKEVLKDDKDAILIAFVRPAIPIAVFAAAETGNRLIISERSDPTRIINKRYGYKFIEKYYGVIEKAVFQTEQAFEVYPENVRQKGMVIPNPLSENLPQSYHGEREKRISTFCRISPEKRLNILIDAFEILHKEYPEYSLRIIGNANNAASEKMKDDLIASVNERGFGDAVEFLPATDKVHDLVLHDAMFVNSSEREGLSNSMLEAMAIGLPTVCTDCPIGGARATITDGENGLLVPVDDIEALYKAMKRVVEEKAFADRLSENGAKLCDELNINEISRRWISLL